MNNFLLELAAMGLNKVRVEQEVQKGILKGKLNN
jgi:hypothetical protein